MSCNDVASVLDNHRIAQLKPAQRAEIDAHLASCADCSAAWQATRELNALRVPSMPPTLLERALLASRVPQSAQSRRARMPIIVGSALLAGAAAAAVTMAVMREQSARTASSPAVEQPAAPVASDGAPDETLTQDVDARAAPAGDGVTSVELVETGRSDVIPLVRANPDYPPEALASGLDGRVQLKFDVTTAGTVENVAVVDSSDAVFEESAAGALAQWRYLPRIVAGKRVRHEGVHTVIVFQLNKDEEPTPTPSQAAAIDKVVREYRDYGAGLVVALDRLAADDFRGVELQLDEMLALYGTERADLWNFYGYLYTLEGNYSRAIDAYEQAVAIALRAERPTSGPIVPLANLYFARHQYDAALKTLLRPNLPGGNRLMSPEANALMQKLNALGVTEDTL